MDAIKNEYMMFSKTGVIYSENGFLGRENDNDESGKYIQEIMRKFNI